MFHSKLDVILRMQVIAIFHNLNLSGFMENNDHFFDSLAHYIGKAEGISYLWR